MLLKQAELKLSNFLVEGYAEFHAACVLLAYHGFRVCRRSVPESLLVEYWSYNFDSYDLLVEFANQDFCKFYHVKCGHTSQTSLNYAFHTTAKHVSLFFFHFFVRVNLAP